MNAAANTYKATKIKKSPARIAFEILNYIIAILGSIIFLLPVLHVLNASLSDPNWLNTQGGLILLPHNPSFGGYQLVFKNGQIWSGFYNTVIYVVGATALGMFLTIIGGYVLSRKDLLWANAIMLFISFTMLFSGGMIASYLLVKGLGMLETRWAVIIPTCMSTFNLIMMRTSFSTVPESLIESAKLDGANEFTIIFRVLMPLVKATVATVALYYIIGNWNSWFTAAIYVSQSRDKWPLQLVLREILLINDMTSATSASDLAGNSDIYKNLVKYCVIMVSSIPMFIVYPFVMKYFKSGVMLGSIKG